MGVPWQPPEEAHWRFTGRTSVLIDGVKANEDACLVMATVDQARHVIREHPELKGRVFFWQETINGCLRSRKWTVILDHSLWELHLTAMRERLSKIVEIAQA